MSQQNIIIPTAPVQPPVNGMDFFVKTITGKTITINMTDENMLVRNVKEVIEKLENIPVDQQRLIFQGKQLEDEQPIKYYGVDADSTLHLVLRLRG